MLVKLLDISLHKLFSPTLRLPLTRTQPNLVFTALHVVLDENLYGEISLHDVSLLAL